MAYTARAMSYFTPLSRRLNPLTWLRNSFLAGVALVLPFVVTVWLIWLVVSIVDSNVVPLIPPGVRPLAESIPGAGVVVALVILTVVGALAGNLIGRWLVDAADHFIANLPVIRSIYGGAKQVFKQVAAPERTSFKEAVLIEFPVAGTWTIAFVTNDETSEVASDTGEPMVAVFVPLVPLPTTGYLLYLPRASLRPMNIGPEEALKRVLSLGILRDAEADAIVSVHKKANRQ